MFLFEGEFGNILHTGDCRLAPDYLQHLPMKYIAKKGKENLCNLDYLFLDCTFGRCSLKIPSKQAAIQQVFPSDLLICIQQICCFFKVFVYIPLNHAYSQNSSPNLSICKATPKSSSLEKNTLHINKLTTLIG